MNDKAMNEKELRKAARAMSDLALQTLANIMNGGGQDTARLAAAREVLDRGHGKPKPAPKTATKTKAATTGDVTVVIQRYTDAPDPEAGEYEERS
jgi:hypothetical protein